MLPADFCVLTTLVLLLWPMPEDLPSCVNTSTASLSNYSLDEWIAELNRPSEGSPGEKAT